MRRIVLAGLVAALALAPVSAQTFDLFEPRPTHRDFANKIAAESLIPVDVSAASRTNFTVRGFGFQEVDLPHTLTVGTWTATLSIRGDNSYSFWLKARIGGDLLELFCKNLICSASDHPTRKRFRVNSAGNAYVDPITSTGTWSVRFVKDRSTPPPPDPDPPPPVTGPCLPTTDVLQFDGGYRVSMCYVTHQGETGQAKAGIWASSQSGILWFFSRENAEVLVKVLDGCRHNGHRWVFVAPVTDVGFELHVTAPNGKIWSHTNEVGTTALTKSDTSAFRCR